MIWVTLHPKMTPEGLGLLPDFFSTSDPRPAAEQLNENYSHGGGWSPMPKWTHLGDHIIQYPGDPALAPLAMSRLRKETLILYRHSIFGIFQEDGTFEIGRVD